MINSPLLKSCSQIVEAIDDYKKMRSQFSFTKRTENAAAVSQSDLDF